MMMVSLLKTLRLISWCLAALMTAALVAQSSPQVGPAAKKARAASAPPWRQMTIRFSDEKVILGLPHENDRSVTYCSDAGTTFVDLYGASSVSGSPAIPELFRISPSGEVKSLHRMMPSDFTDVSIRDFFAADRTLVTLVEAVKRDRDDHGDTSVPREVRYFLSLSDYDGGFPKLLPLELRFKPLKIAQFGSGDFLVLGWDAPNLLPLMALVKEDGTVRRFIDLDERHHPEFFVTHGSLQEEESSVRTGAALALLQKAEFVPYGSQVLLTYPGTAKSVGVLSAMGEDRSIPIELPGGFVLHDVLVSGAGYPLILRAQPAEVSGKSATAGEANPQQQQQRLFEMNSHNGSLLKEFLFDKPRLDAVKCASASRLTAIFYDTIADTAHPAAVSSEQAKATEDPTQLVIATAPR
jgi:hypothetical protein